MGVVESVPKPRKRDGNPPYLRVVTLHAQIASTFPENPPRILLRFCSVFAPIFIGHPSTWGESCFRND